MGVPEVSPRDVCCVVHCQPNIVLMICHIKVGYEVVCFRISNVCSVEEGAEEKECQNGENSTEFVSEDNN